MVLTPFHKYSWLSLNRQIYNIPLLPDIQTSVLPDKTTLLNSPCVTDVTGYLTPNGCLFYDVDAFKELSVIIVLSNYSLELE